MRKILQIAVALLTIQTLLGNGYGIVELTEDFVEGMPPITLKKVKERIENKVTFLFVGTYGEWIILSDTKGCSELIEEGYYPIPNYHKISKKGVSITHEIILENGVGLWGPVGKEIESIDLKNLTINCQQGTGEEL